MADKFFDAMFTASVIGGSSGPASVIVSKNVTANGTYSALDDQADGYNPVIVNVPNTYTAGDEGKVVSGGALVAQTSTTATTNGTINTTTNNEVVVNVPNTYTAVDEGKVVSSGALVAQTAYPTTITDNNTYDTTNYNSITVNVASALELSKLSSVTPTSICDMYMLNGTLGTYVVGQFQISESSQYNAYFQFDNTFTPTGTINPVLMIKRSNSSTIDTSMRCSIDNTNKTLKVTTNNTSSYFSTSLVYQIMIIFSP